MFVICVANERYEAKFRKYADQLVYYNKYTLSIGTHWLSITYTQSKF